MKLDPEFFEIVDQREGNDPTEPNFRIRVKFVRETLSPTGTLGAFLTRRIAEFAWRLLDGKAVMRDEPTRGRFHPRKYFLGWRVIYDVGDGSGEITVAENIDEPLALLLSRVLGEEDARAALKARELSEAEHRAADLEALAGDRLAQALLETALAYANTQGEEISDDDWSRAQETAGFALRYGSELLDDVRGTESGR